MLRGMPQHQDFFTRSPRRSHGDSLLKALCLSSALAVVVVFGLLTFSIAYESLRALRTLGLRLLTDPWMPAYDMYGLSPSIKASLLVTLLSLALSLPVSLLSSIFLVFYARPRVREAVRILVELLAGIPSVVYGMWGLTVLVPLLNQTLGPLIGSSLGWLSPWFQFTESTTGNLLAASVVLSVMILPILFFTQVEFLLAVPREYVEASLSLGATRWQMVKTLALPYALPGVILGVVLGMGRAIGETMAVSMVAGPENPPRDPSGLFSPATPLTTLILMNMGSLTPGFFEWSVMFSAALILLAISASSMLVVKLLSRRARGVLAVASWLYKPSGRLALVEEGVVAAVMAVCLALVGGVLTAILADVVVNGGRAALTIGVPVLTECLRLTGAGGRAVFTGGLLNDVIGSLLLSLLSTLIALPVGVLVGIYLAEYAEGSRLGGLVRSLCDALTSIPTIILGVIGYAILVVYLRDFTGGLSLLSGSLTLSVLVTPFIARGTEEALRAVPRSVKEAVVALGGTRLHVVEVSLRQAAPAIMCSVLGGFLRALSESAPVILTAGPSNFIPSSLRDPVGCLPVRIFLLGFEYRVFKGALDYAYAASLILVAAILLVNTLVRVLSRRARRYTV